MERYDAPPDDLFGMSEDAKRCVREVPFGLACYEGGVTDGQWSGKHVGVVGTVADAKRFLAGKEPKKLIRLYTPEGGFFQ